MVRVMSLVQDLAFFVHSRAPSSNIGVGFGLKAPQEAWQPGGAQETPGSLEEIQREMAELDR